MKIKKPKTWVAFTILILLCAVSNAADEDCYKATIVEPKPFNGNGGEVIILSDGTIWKDSTYAYLYLYEYYPTVIICPSKGLMYLKNHKFFVTYMGNTEKHRK